MSVILKPDGTLEFDTPEEVVAYQNASRNGSANSGKRAGRSRRVSSEDEPLPDAALKLVKHLLPLSGGANTSDMARALGFKEAKGIGGAVTSLTSWGRRHGFSKKQLITKTRQANGHRVMALTESFRKIIKEGKVLGVKLEP